MYPRRRNHVLKWATIKGKKMLRLQTYEYVLITSAYITIKDQLKSIKFNSLDFTALFKIFAMKTILNGIKKAMKMQYINSY